MKKILNIDLLKTINNFKVSEKINWISNCVKHYDGFPIKEPIPDYLSHFDKSKKIEIESAEFKNDIENLSAQNQLILSILFMVGFHQVLSQKFETIRYQLKPENQSPEIIAKLKHDFEYVISRFFNNKNIT